MSLHESIIYGPVKSRRLGRSLGVNLTPAHVKMCSFNCAYCQYGWSEVTRSSTQTALANWPSAVVVAKAVAGALRVCAAQGDRIERITLAGHGEPTMHPDFKQVVAALRKTRDQMAPKLPIAILSNSGTLERADVRQAISELDERYMKLDAGDAATLRKINGAAASFEQIVDGLSKLKDIVIQGMFIKDRSGRLDNTSDLAVINWVVALQRIKPRAVHVYTLDRAPAFPYLQPVSPARLKEIGQRVRIAGLTCEVFGIPDGLGVTGEPGRAAGPA
jgi:wyosine [tRNA(Phe)-imidazoG37] synthetase (radical SAM superfamily)